MLTVLVNLYEIKQHPAVLDSIRQVLSRLNDRIGRLLDSIEQDAVSLTGFSHGLTGAARSMIEEIQKEESYWVQNGNSHSAFFGTGSFIYLYSYLGSLWEDDSLLERALNLIPRVLEQPNQTYIADDLLQKAIYSERGEGPFWISNNAGDEKMVFLSPLPMGLYDGMAGLAIFFAQAGKVLNEQVYTDESEGFYETSSIDLAKKKIQSFSEKDLNHQLRYISLSMATLIENVWDHAESGLGQKETVADLGKEVKQASTHPDYLTAGDKREQLFDYMWMLAKQSEKANVFIPDEIVDLLLHDIPYFTFYAGGTSLLNSRGEHAPKLNGRPVSAVSYTDFIVEGFKNAYAIMMKHKEELAGPSGFLNLFKHDEVRHVFRPTHVYGKFL
ncbi:DUF4135 domain-containing protein [Bacillus licheniformis]|nr:DUF4135 domain-containing protein [Bacillus licheniformis]